MAVEDIIENQIDAANNAIEQADAFLGVLSDMASSSYFAAQSNANIPPPVFGWDSTEEILDLLTALFPDPIEVDEISGTQPTYTPTEIDTSVVDVTIPEFTSSAPTLTIPAAPSSDLPSVPPQPAINDPAIPSAPVVALPAVPVITDVTMPEMPVIELPVFTASAPIDDLVAPTNNFSFFEEAYSSALLDAVKAKLLEDIQNGGYGIEPNDEAALWDRARARELETAMQQVEQLFADAAARGFPYPPGDMNVAIQRAHQALQDKVSTVSRDIALKRADMYVENRKFTIEQSKSLEQILLGYHGSVQERALNAAKAVLEASIAIFNAQVAKYNAQLEAYKTEATVYESRIRAALANLEMYKVQMEGKRLEMEIQNTRVALYNAQLQGVNTVINLYKSQVEAAQVVANIERTRIDAYRALIDAYTAQVQAKVAEFNMYDSQIKGELAKVQVYEAEARAYTSVVSGAKTRADVQIAQLDAEIKVAGNAIDVYKAQLEGYKADLGAQAQTVSANVAVYDGQVRGASARANATAEGFKLQLGKNELQLKRNIENAKIAIEDAKIMLDGALKSAEIRMRAGSAAGEYYRALVSGAVNSISTLTSLIEQA